MSLTKAFHVVRRLLWLQSVQRHYFALVLEVISVAGLSKLIVPTDAPKVDPQRLMARPEPIIYDAYEANKQSLQLLAVVYRPKNPETDDLIEKAFGQGRLTTVTSLMKKSEMESKCREQWAKYGSRVKVVCVEFADVFGVTAGGSLDYELLQAAQQEVPEQFPLTGPKSFSLEAIDSLKNDFDLILAEQAKIDHQFLERAKTVTAQLPKVLLRRLPDAPPFRDQENFRSTIDAVTLTIFCIPFLRRVSAISAELATGMKDQQRINGLPVPAFWLGHFLSAFSIQMVESVIIVGIMYFAPGHSNTTFYRNVDVSLVLFVMILFNTGHILLAMVVAAVFKKGNRAMFGAIFLGFFIPLFTQQDKRSLSKFVFQDRWSKLKLSIYPQIGCSTVLRTLAIFDDYHGGAGWGIIFKRALNFDSVTVFEVLVIMMATCVVEVFLLFYLSNVLPWATDYPKSPLFCLMPGYWLPVRVVPVAEATAQEMRDPERFEASPDIAAAADIHSLTMRYGSFTALDKVSFKIYSTQVTALLGHNGAGKTTLMSTITGLLQPTAGTINFCGGETDGGTKSTSFCQQFDVLFPDLTVKEHLLYFGQMQGRWGDELNKSIHETLEAVRLTDKTNAFPPQLSGGMKRRLSMAIALVAKPKLLILDEPTTGMDPETRRSIWDLLSALRKDTTILLSTHDMEEAEVLADRIVMLSSGKLVCAGSPAFLKRSCGVGYTISVNTESADFDLKETLNIVRETAPGALLQDVKQGTTTLALQTIEHKGFAKMFKQLEEESDRLGIASFGVSVATMADAYIKINQLWVPHDGEDDQHMDIRSVQSGHHTSLMSHMTVPTTSSGVQRLHALFCKRLIYWSRSPLTILLGWIAPVALFYMYCFGLSLPTRHSSDVNTGLPGTLDLRSSVHFGAARCFLEEAPVTNFSKYFEALAVSEGATIERLKIARRDLVELATKDFVKYYSQYAYGIAFNATTIEGWYNPASRVSGSVLLNLINTALLRAYSGSPKARITTSVSFHNAKASGEAEDGTTSAKASFISVASFWLISPQAILGLTVSTMAIFPVAEKTSGALELQLMTGVSGTLYVMSHFIFDLLVQYLLPFGVSLALYSLLYETELHFTGIVALYLVGLSFAPVAIFWPYLLSNVIGSEGGAFTATLALFVVGGPVTLLLYLLTLFKMSPRMARFTWMLLSPPFALGQAATQAVVQGKIAYICRRMPERKGHAIGPRAAINNLRRAVAVHNFGAYYQRAVTEVEEDPCSVGFFSLSANSAMPDVLLLACEGLVLFVLVSLSHSGYHLDIRKAISPGARFFRDGKEDITDEDVKAEKELAEHLAATGASQELEQQGYTLVAHNLHKWFGSFEAVKGINLALRRGECFGLLGVNGAGKSTTFQMLSGLLDLSSGDAYMSDIRLSISRRQWQSFIGYCPQTNGLLEKLNAFEHLRLFARLRGVPGYLVEAAVQAAILLVDVEKHARNQCGTYSGGNKRKLSIALAILGNPRVIFLDEPFAGIDVVARNTITGRLATMRIEGNIPVVFTSHGMEECETACDRMCIMVAGQMTCLGTLQHLRDKFGTGYTMQLVLARTEPPVPEGSAPSAEIKSSQTLEKDVVSLFPGARVLGTHDNVHDYHVKEKLRWSIMFEKVELLEESYTFSHVLIQDTNLEQIFISFAEKRSAVSEA